MDYSNFITEIDGESVELKYCSKCDVFKELCEFYKRTQNEDGFDFVCKRCSTKKEDRRDYHERLTSTEEGRKRVYDYDKDYRKRRPDVVTAKTHKRRAIEKALEGDFNGKQWTEIISRFGVHCSISDSEDFVLEHVIPIAWGHGGTTTNNCVPMDAKLNSSKSDRNIFKWIQDKVVQDWVDMDKFEELIEYLAFMNDTTPQEYREFVYWCEANKRTVEECQKDTRPSVEIWKAQRGN